MEIKEQIMTIDVDQECVRCVTETDIGEGMLIVNIEFNELNINYYCAYDDMFVLPSINQKWYSLLKNLDLRYFFPESWKEYNFDFKKSCYVKYNKRNQLYNGSPFSYNPSIGFNNGESVIINMCIPLAFFMGFKHIILLGCECDYSITNNNQLNNAYFYPIKKHDTLNSHSQKSAFEWQKKLLKSYNIISKTAKNLNINILNATVGGVLEAFPRSSLTEILQKD